MLGCINATLHQLVRCLWFQFFSGMVRLFGPRLLDQFNALSIYHPQFAALFAEHHKRCPARMRLQSKGNFHQCGLFIHRFRRLNFALIIVNISLLFLMLASGWPTASELLTTFSSRSIDLPKCSMA